MLAIMFHEVEGGSAKKDTGGGTGGAGFFKIFLLPLFPLMALGGLLLLLGKALFSFIPLIQPLLKALWRGIKLFGRLLGQLLKKAWALIRTFFRSLRRILSVLSTVIRKMIAMGWSAFKRMMQLLKGITTLLRNILRTVFSALKAVWKFAQFIMKSLWRAFKIIASALQRFFSFANGFFSLIGRMLTFLFAFTKRALRMFFRIVQAIAQIVRSFLSAFPVMARFIRWIGRIIAPGVLLLKQLLLGLMSIVRIAGIFVFSRMKHFTALMFWFLGDASDDEEGDMHHVVVIKNSASMQHDSNILHDLQVIGWHIRDRMHHRGYVK